jgi:hypothetical protein
VNQLRTLKQTHYCLIRMNESKAQVALTSTKSRVQHGISQDPGLVLTALACEYSANSSPKGTIEIALANAKKDSPKLVVSASPEDTVSHLLDAIFAHTGILPGKTFILFASQEFVVLNFCLRSPAS